MLSRILRTVALVIPGLCYGQETAKLDEAVQSFVKTGKFMGVVLVVRGDDVLLSKGYGSANLEWNIPNDPATKFRIGSVTKQFTAAAILLLEERGKLKIDDPVKVYLPDAPAAWDKVTIFHLLTHTSGIPNFTSFPGFETTQGLATTPEELVARFCDKPLEFAPGEKWNYSNSGYVLLGYLIEKVSGVEYAKFVKENIFDPLRMKDSGYDSNTAIISHRAAGYAASAEGPLNADFVHMSIPFAAGGLYSTTEDLWRWEQGLFGGKILKPESLRKMTTPYKNNYALGVVVANKEGQKTISHNGGIEGFMTQLTYYPDEKLTIAVLGNLEDEEEEAPAEIATRLGNLLHGKTSKASKRHEAIAVPVGVLQQYVGTYEITYKVKNYVRLEGDHLTTQLTSQEALPLFAESPTKFFLKVVDAQIEFAKNEKGEITHLVMYQDGHETEAKRISAMVDAPPEAKVVTVSVEKLKEYVGTYALTPNFEIAITLRGNQLMEQATRQPKFPIFPESETMFFLKVVEARIEFVRDAGGKVTSLILHQNGQHQKGMRK